MGQPAKATKTFKCDSRALDVSRFNTQSALQLIAYYGIILEVKYLLTLFYTGFKK